MTAYKKVAVAGATGNLGPSLVRELVNAGFEVTILSRSGNIDPPIPGIAKVIKVDYDSVESLTNALKGQEVVVSNIPNHNGQNPLIDASIAAGVKRFLPSEFGSNISGNSKTANLPVFKDGKLFTQNYLLEKGDAISWTVVVTGLFLDWGMRVGFVINYKGTTRLFDNGEKQFSATLLSDIGKAVVGVLKHPEETKNRTVYVQSALVSQKLLLELAKEVNPSLELATKPEKIAEAEKAAYVKLQKGEEIREAMIDFIYTSAVGDGFGSNWDAKNDNELLGIKQLSREELKKVVAQYV